MAVTRCAMIWTLLLMVWTTRRAMRPQTVPFPRGTLDSGQQVHRHRGPFVGLTPTTTSPAEKKMEMRATPTGVPQYQRGTRQRGDRRRRNPLPAHQVTPTTPTRTQRRLKRSMHTTMMDGGRTHPSSWREQSWTRPGTTLSISSVASCGRTNLTSVTGQSLVKLARYGAAWRRLPGLIFKDWRHSASWASSCVNGLPLSSGPLTSTTLDEPGPLPRDRPGPFPVGRPRSMCNKHFQALAAVHPHSPEFKPLFTRRRQTRRRVRPLPCGAAVRQPSRCTAGRPAYTSRVKLLPNLLLKPRHKILPHTPTVHKTQALCNNCCSQPQNRLAPRCSGPKSGDHGISLRPLKLVAFYAMVGVRVSSAAATEEGPTTGTLWSVGKPSGLAQRGGEQTSITKSSKRAFSRACKRANQALDGGTWYKGRWHSRQALASLRQSAPMPVLRQTPSQNPSQAFTESFSFRLEYRWASLRHATRVHGVV